MQRLFLFLLIGLLALPSFGVFAQTVKPEITSFKTTSEPFLVETVMQTLSWSSKNATYCIAGGDWSGTKDPSGSFTYYPSAIGYANYQLTCYDSIGNVSTPVALTPFVGSIGTMKQKGSIAVVSAKVTSSKPDNTVVVVDFTQTPGVASLVFFEQTESPAVKADMVSMFVPATAIKGQRVTFAFDGQTKMKAGSSYSYTITAQGANTTDLTTYRGGSLTVTSAPTTYQEDLTGTSDFRVEAVRIDTSEMSDGTTRIETEKNVYVTFSHPAKAVKTTVTSFNDAGTQLASDYKKTYEYPSSLYQQDQKSFAAGTFNELPLGRKFQYVVEGQHRDTGTPASYTGTFTTAPKILISDVTILPGDTSTYITWKTNVPTGSAVEYQQGSEQSNFEFSEQEYPQTFHKVKIKDLKPDTEYKATVHVYIHNDDETDTTAKADPLMFRTISSTPEILISDVTFTPSDTSASVTWKTNIPAGSSVEYQQGSGQAIFVFSEQEYPQIFHKVTIKDLKPDTEYKATVHAYIHHDGKQDTTKKLVPTTFRTRSSTAASDQFKITSMRVDKLDGLGKPTEEERSFAVSTSHPFSKITISIWEAPNTSITQQPYTSFTTSGIGTLTQTYVSPGGFDKKFAAKQNIPLSHYCL